MKKTEQFVFELNGDKLNLVINRKKIKNTYIRIDDNKQIIVNTNAYTTLDYIKTLITKHQDKILKQIEQKNNKLLPEDKIMYLGKIYNLLIISNQSFAYKITDDTILLYTNKKGLIAVDEFYKVRSQEIFSTLLIKAYKFFETNYFIPYPELEIRKMKSRYGTCYYKRNKICLNLYLIKHDVSCIDYVINHELCHFIHHDHSKEFYNLLGTVVKNHRDLRRRLFNL